MDESSFWSYAATRLDWTRRRIASLCFFLAAFSLAVHAHAQAPLPADTLPRAAAAPCLAERGTSILSKESLRFRYVIEQGTDDSCGFAAAATLLSLYWGIDVSEGELLSFKALLRTDGSYEISMKGIADTLARFGLASRGYSMDYAQLIAALARFGPVIAHYDKPWPHFVVVVGYAEGRFAVADPARGLLALAPVELGGYWSGAVLVCACRGRVSTPSRPGRPSRYPRGSASAWTGSARVSGRDELGGAIRELRESLKR